MREKNPRWLPAAASAAALLLAACGQRERPADAAPRVEASATASNGSGAFVGARGGDFYLHGRPFRHVGANTPGLVYQPADQVRRTLDELEGAGVRQIRVFLPNDAMRGNNWGPQEIGDRFRYVLDEALRRDIRVTAALAHNYFQDVWAWEGRGGKHAAYGDRGFYTRAIGGGLFMLNDHWIDWGHRGNGGPHGSYRDFAWAIASRFRDHPGVFAWDIANEVNVSDVRNAFLLDRQVAFYRETAAMLKAADPNHMVTTGLVSTSWAGLDDARRRQLYEDPNVDYVVVHEYENDNRHNEKHDIWLANNWLNPRKPVVVEEAGIKAAKDNFALMEGYFADMYDNRGVDAILQWGVQVSCPRMGGADWGSGDGDHGPCEQGRLLEYKDLWARWAGELDRRNGGSAFPEKLVQVFFRGNERHSRRVPVANGAPDWGAARGWVRELTPRGLPGSGDVQAHNLTAWPNRTIMESVWRGDRGYWRTVPVNPGGQPNWAAAGGWSSPIPVGTLPGAGGKQSQDDSVFPNGATLLQSYWRGNQGYWRTVPMQGGQPNWAAAGGWSAPIALGTMPGSGDMQAHDGVVFTNGAAMMQSVWRGDSGYWRTVPMRAGAPDWGAAGGWSAPIGSWTMPGSGTVRAQSSHFTGWPR